MTGRMLGEYLDAADFLRAVRALRTLGYQDLEVYTPFPLHGIDEALGQPRSRLPRLVFAVGVCAAAGAYGLQWLLNAYLYPLDVGKRPPHFPLSFVPITFEMGVLFAAFAAFVGVLVAGRLLRLWHPVFEVERFESASNDHYWIEVQAHDPRFDLQRTSDDLRHTGAARVVLLEGVS